METTHLPPNNIGQAMLLVVRHFILFVGIGFLIIVISIPHAAASPWPRQQGSYFVSTGTDIFNADGDFIFDPPPLTDSQNDLFERIQTNIYVEYGLTNKWLISAKASHAFTTVTSPNSITTSNGLSEIEGLIQRQVWKTKRDILSLGVAFGKNNTVGGGARPGLESDGVDTEARALYGRSWNAGRFNLFTTAELAYRRRFGSPADQIRADIKVGFEPHDRILMLFDVFSVASLRNNDPGGTDFDVIKLEPAIALRFYRKWRIHAGANVEIAGRNLERGRTFFINLWSPF